MTAKNSAEKRRIVLIGFRGSGKSTLAAELARCTGLPLLSTDRMIEEREGTAISELVAAGGWPRFRQAEAELIAGLRRRTGVIIDCGGGVVENPQNMAALRPDSLMVWVDADPADLEARLHSAGNRPLLNRADPAADLRENYRRRLPLYRRYSDLRVDTSRYSPAEICETILAGFRDRNR